MLEDIDMIKIVRDNLHPLDFEHSEARYLAETLFSINKDSIHIDATRIINYLEGRVESNFISFIVNEDMEIKDKNKNVTDCIKTIKKRKKDEQLKDIQNRIASAQKNGRQEEATNLSEEFSKLLKTGA